MSAVEDPKLTRDDLLDILNEMSVAIPRDTKLKTSRIRHRLERTLDAAQRYSGLFGSEATEVNPSNYPLWDERKDIYNALFLKCFAGIPWGGLKEGIREVVFTDEKTTGIILRVSEIRSINEIRPLLVLGYAVLAMSKTTMKQTIKDFLAKEKNFNILMGVTTGAEQALLLQLLVQNSKRLSPNFASPADLNDRFSVSFLLPTAWLSMQDVGRLNKTSGCVACGEPTRNRCGGCNSTQYCGKECQRKHWPDHKFLCRTISSGTWHTVSLEPHPATGMSGRVTSCINRFDDLTEPTLMTKGQPSDKVPPNVHNDSYHIVKLQLPLMSSASHMLVYDRGKSFQLFFVAEKNPGAFIEAVKTMGLWPKMYRWAQRVSDWEWRICFDREPDPLPLW